METDAELKIKIDDILKQKHPLDKIMKTYKMD